MIVVKCWVDYRHRMLVEPVLACLNYLKHRQCPLLPWTIIGTSQSPDSPLIWARQNSTRCLRMPPFWKMLKSSSSYFPLAGLPLPVAFRQHCPVQCLLQICLTHLRSFWLWLSLGWAHTWICVWSAYLNSMSSTSHFPTQRRGVWWLQLQSLSSVPILSRPY